MSSANVIDRLESALCVISTSVSAIARSQDQEGIARREDICEELATLQYGVGMLRKSVEEIQVAWK